MVRKDLFRDERHERSVRWSLISAAVALSVGLLIQNYEKGRDFANERAPVDSVAVTVSANG